MAILKLYRIALAPARSAKRKHHHAPRHGASKSISHHRATHARRFASQR